MLTRLRDRHSETRPNPAGNFVRVVQTTADPAELLVSFHDLFRHFVDGAPCQFGGDVWLAAVWPEAGGRSIIDLPETVRAYAVEHPACSDIGEWPIDTQLIPSGTIAPLVFGGECVGVVCTPALAASVVRQQITRNATLAAAALAAARAQNQAADRSRILAARAEELGIAEIIQRSLLPTDLPAIPDWTIATHYSPARTIGGDLYDFVPLPNGLFGVVLGDASDKGVPAALMMATAKALLRASIKRLVLPALVLAQVNADLCQQIPAGMFVTCFLGLLDPGSGRFRYANAGQTAPFVLTADGPIALDARGWPLGMLPERSYDEGEIILEPGQGIVLYSDGVSESTNAAGDLFGVERIRSALEVLPTGADPVAALDVARADHSREVDEQDDDITSIALMRRPAAVIAPSPEPNLVATFVLPSTEDSSPEAARLISEAAERVPLTPKRRDRLFTAVAEAVMNAAEHGNDFRPDLTVGVELLIIGGELVVRVRDQGKNGSIPDTNEPDLDAKLAGLQSTRGWGLFLIERLVDRVELRHNEFGNCIELALAIGVNVPDREITSSEEE